MSLGQMPIEYKSKSAETEDEPLKRACTKTDEQESELSEKVAQGKTVPHVVLGTGNYEGMSSSSEAILVGSEDCYAR